MKLIEIGAEIEKYDDAVRVVAAQRIVTHKIKTLPYPGFPTDIRPTMAITLGLYYRYKYDYRKYF